MNKLLNNPLISVLLVLAIIAFLVYRQLRPRKISLRGLVLFPALIFFFNVKSLPGFHPTSLKLMEMIITSLVSIVLGLLACRELKIYKSGSGKAMAKGSWRYFLWWLGAFIIKAILSALFGETKFATVSQIEILIPVFLLIVTRNGYLYLKAKQLGLDL